MHNERAIVHHDIKPENIMVDSGDVAKLTDFGISVKLDESGDDVVLNHEWGTKLYLPPESWSRSQRLTEGSTMHGKAMDVWALGCTFYQLIYNKFPFVNSFNMPETRKSIMNDE